MKFRELLEVPKRMFAIGDIHGCLNEPRILLEYLQAQQQLDQDDLVIFIGDYIDRGSESKPVIEYLLEFKLKFPKTIFLRGNHEDMLLGYLGLEGSQGAAYIQNGGADFLSSYGLLDAPNEDVIISGIPEEHLKFLQETENYVIAGDYVFAHAGLSPLRALRSQRTEDLFWIRDEFIGNIHHFEKTVVFGHTPYKDILFHIPYKIGIDTGLVYGNMLSCIEVREGEIFQVGRGGENVQLSTFIERVK